MAASTGRDPVLVVAGGETLFDYRAYRAEFEADVRRLVATGTLAPDAVRDLGPVPDEMLAALYRASDVLAFPSVKEGWGLAVLEAQASGTPVVASDIEVLREYLVDGGNALLVPLDDPEALAAALVRVTTDEGLASRLRAAGAATARAFSWGAAAERQLAFYRR